MTKYTTFDRNYEKFPLIEFPNSDQFYRGYAKLIEDIQSHGDKLIILETYPGVRISEIKANIIDKLHHSKKSIHSEDCAISEKDYLEQIKFYLTDDEVFGRFTLHSFNEYFDNKKVNSVKAKINKQKIKIVYGINASLFANENSVIYYFDMNRWEIQVRYQKNERVYFRNGLEDSKTKNFKRGYFVEWRMADRLKRNLFNKIHMYIDTTFENDPKIITNELFNNIVKDVSRRPFRLVPYFDKGIWGGKWMNEVCDLSTDPQDKWAWCFDGVPEENQIAIKLGSNAGDFFQMPSVNVIFLHPRHLLGDRVWNRFGCEFPIRFDFLDTVKGGNLSLQVHPTTDYIQTQFGAHYTQEESYYYLDAYEDENPVCYLGFKDSNLKDEFIKDLTNSQRDNKLDVDKYINLIPVKKHDHVIHPCGTIHSSGSGGMVLEISSTPYIFTFKLWDWARLQANGKPRPINIRHGLNVLDYSRDEKFCKEQLVNTFKVIKNTPLKLEEKTGLHNIQYIETRRITIKTNKGVTLETHDSVNMLNLVEGEEVLVKSVNNEFPSIVVHYAETFIVPESCKQYVLIPTEKSKGSKLIILQAFVRTN